MAWTSRRDRSRHARVSSFSLMVGTAAVLALSFFALAPVEAVESPLMVATKLRGLVDESVVHDGQAFSSPMAKAAANAVLGFRRLDTTDDVTAKANEVGASVRDAIKQLRGGTDKFYNDLIAAAKIYLCEQDAKNKERWVDKSDELAYKDDDGDCVKIPNPVDPEVQSQYATSTTCEVKPNCYWAPIEASDTTTRRTVYADSGEMTVTEAEDAIKKWATGLLVFVVPGVVLSVLSLITMILFLICRCCCNRCGGRAPREEGYTCMQKFLPLIFYLIFAIGVLAVSAVALTYRDTMLDAVSDTFNATSGTLVNGSGWIVSIRTPLEDIRDTVLTSADLIQVELAGTDFIEEGVTGLEDRLRLFGSYSADRTLPTGCEIDDGASKDNVDENGATCLPCEVCTTISTEVDTAADQMNANAGPGVEQLADVRNQLETKLVGISDDVRSAVNTQVENANDLILTVDSTRADVDSVDDQFQSVRDLVGYAVMAFFALALSVVALGFIGIIFGLTPLKFLANILHVAYLIGFLALFLTFIVSAIALAVGVVMGDMCEVTLIFSTNWTVPLGEEAKAIDACFQNQSLLEVFNLSSQLDFARGGIEFPDLEVSSMLDFSELDSFAEVILDTDESTFPFDETALTDGVVVLNEYAQQSDGLCKPNDIYTMDYLLEPWTNNGEVQVGGETPLEYIEARYKNYDGKCDGSTVGKEFACSDGSPCLFSKFMVEVYEPLYSLAAIKRDMSIFVEELHTNITVVTDYTDDFKSKTTDLDSAINDIKVDLEGSLIKYVGDFERAMYCTFIADGFFTIYESLCGDLMPALTMLALMLFLAGVFLIPVNICLIIAVKRLKAHGNGHVMDTEMKFK